MNVHFLGAKTTWKTCSTKANNNGRTPLHLAARNYHRGVIKILIELGADMDKADNDGNTPREHMDWL